MAMIVDMTKGRQAEEILRRTREEIESRVELRMRVGGAYGLTFREFTVLHHVAAGKSDKESGAELGISPLTVQNTSPISSPRWTQLRAPKPASALNGKGSWTNWCQRPGAPATAGTLRATRTSHHGT